MALEFLLKEESVFTQIPDQRMVLLESQLSLRFFGRKQGPDIAQPPGSFGAGQLTGAIDLREGMPINQSDQAHQAAHAANAAILCHRLSPQGAGGSQVAGPIEPILQVGLESSVTTADAARVGKLSWL
jgi:hypothetical protein